MSQVLDKEKLLSEKVHDEEKTYDLLNTRGEGGGGLQEHLTEFTFETHPAYC